MTELITQVNESEVLTGTEISADEGQVFPGATPVLARPAAFLGGVAVTCAVVGALARLSARPQTQDALLWYVALQANASCRACERTIRPRKGQGCGQLPFAGRWSCSLSAPG
ncbi:hypothetical protein AB0G35_09475 [Streptomyces sp. NPDC021749]|uniref:hypothetical protein n=1 Tax=Streptomyces sp. NPDC021749 TaxID=3154905 RepID=UPI00340727BE